MGIGFIQRRQGERVDWRRCPHPFIEELPRMDREGCQLRCMKCGRHLHGSFKVYDEVNQAALEDATQQNITDLQLSLDAGVWDDRGEGFREGYSTAIDQLRISYWGSPLTQRGKHAAEGR